MSVARSALRPLIARAAAPGGLARTLVTLPRHTVSAPIVVASRSSVHNVPAGVRWKSESAPKRNAWAKDPIVSYEELKPITQQPSDNILLVDVREPDEVALGSIPSAVSLPLSQLRDALDPKYNAGEFQKNFAFPKPLPSQNIIFFCRSGKRSATAAEWAGEKGYPNVRNYVGSWLDWTKREKANESEDD
ncbi:hypothetical protein EHS25_007995 [Saitozyma podzolica]|uniref:Rhodanese domain-containing protein n=1 Tax=Saitozyma podzolica TaxID=1890683 RepID=A0A427YNB9_9TREE|nr:hypothetical protein EHS25_007995 [Saitozyma podzolica]